MSPGPAVAISVVRPTKSELEMCDTANSVVRPFMYKNSRPPMPGLRMRSWSKLTSTRNSPHTPKRPLLYPTKLSKVDGEPNVSVAQSAPPTAGK